MNTAIGLHYREWATRPIVITPPASTANQHIATKTMLANPSLYSISSYGDPFRYEEHDDSTCQIMIVQAKLNNKHNFTGDHEWKKATNILNLLQTDVF